MSVFLLTALHAQLNVRVSVALSILMVLGPLGASITSLATLANVAQKSNVGMNARRLVVGPAHVAAAFYTEPKAPTKIIVTSIAPTHWTRITRIRTTTRPFHFLQSEYSLVIITCVHCYLGSF